MRAYQHSGVIVLWIFSVGVALYYRESFLALTQEIATWPLLLVVGAFMTLKIVGAIAMVPGAPLTLATGALLPLPIAMVVAFCGNLAGAIAAFALSRWLFAETVVRKLMQRYPKMTYYRKRYATEELRMVVALRLIPLVPFNALNYLLGALSVRTREYIMGSAIGLLPGTVLYVLLGSGVGAWNRVHIAIAIIGLGILVYLGKRIA